MGGAPCRQSLSEVCHRVLQHVGHAIAAEQCSFALVTDNRAGGKCLSGVVFHMHEDDSRGGQGQPNWDKCIMEHIVETGKAVNIMDVCEVTTAGCVLKTLSRVAKFSNKLKNILASISNEPGSLIDITL